MGRVLSGSFCVNAFHLGGHTEGAIRKGSGHVPGRRRYVFRGRRPTVVSGTAFTLMRRLGRGHGHAGCQKDQKR